MRASHDSVPEGTPVHFHCYARVEWSHDPKNWVDVAAVQPDHTAWKPVDASAWSRSQLTDYLSEAEEAHGRLAWLEHCLKNDDLWDRQTASMSRGRWQLFQFYLRYRHVLVLTTLAYADSSCQHARPADQPYEPPQAVMV